MSTPTPTLAAAGLELTPEQEELQARARRFTEEELIPREELSERNGGRLPAAEIGEIRAAAIEARLNGGRHKPENGGQGWSMLETFSGRRAVRPLHQRPALVRAAGPTTCSSWGPPSRSTATCARPCAARATPPTR